MCVWVNDRKTVGGARYYLRFNDNYLTTRRVFITTKSQLAECLRKLKSVGEITNVLLWEGGMEFNCEVVQIVLQYVIVQRLAIHIHPEQNGSAEQENRTIVENARCMLHASGLPKKLWAEACIAAVYIHNRA